MKILILGAGKMVDALIQGITPDDHHYYFYSPSRLSAEKLAKKYRAFSVDENFIPDPDFILLAHKPQQLQQVADHLNGRFMNIPFISMLAAIDEETQSKVLGVSRLARIMPNLNVRSKKGVTLLSSASFDKNQIDIIKKWLSPTGIILKVNEEQLDELTLLTGCGPALFYQFAILLSKSFHTISLEDCFKLTEQVLKGSADLINEYNGDFQEAIKDVASKGGVTEAILSTWNENHLINEIEKGIVAGKKRSKDLRDSILQK